MQVMATPRYAQLDSGTDMRFGTSVLVSGTNGQKAGQWKHYYYAENDSGWITGVSSDGNSANTAIYVAAIAASKCNQI